MSIVKLIKFISISFTFLIPLPSSFCQNQMNEARIDEEKKFANIRETWDAVQERFMFFSDKFNCSHQDDNHNLTLPEQRTLIAVLLIPLFGTVLLILTCCICGHRLFYKPDVPPYLTFHFPLYRNVAESQNVSPNRDEPHCDSLSHTFPNLNGSSTSHRCP